MVYASLRRKRPIAYLVRSGFRLMENFPKSIESMDPCMMSQIAHTLMFAPSFSDMDLSDAINIAVGVRKSRCRQ